MIYLKIKCTATERYLDGRSRCERARYGEIFLAVLVTRLETLGSFGLIYEKEPEALIGALAV
jgi:hypothetical protein